MSYLSKSSPKSQFQLKLEGIINASLSQSIHSCQLLKLEMSRLVIIECTNEGVFTINVTKAFVVEEFAPKILARCAKRQL